MESHAAIEASIFVFVEVKDYFKKLKLFKGSNYLKIKNYLYLRLQVKVEAKSLF